MKKRGLVGLWVGVAAMVAVWSCGGGKMSPAVAPSAITPSSDSHGTFTDPRDGQTYRTVVMPDGKTWMAENLNYKDTSWDKKYVKGSVTVAIGDKASWCYENNADSCAKYGRLYTWTAAKEACPAGWRLPDTSDWLALNKSVGGGAKLTSKTGWNEGPGAPIGNDDYGFTALPGGNYDGNYGDVGWIGKMAFWWFTMDTGADDALYWRLGYYRDELVGYANDDVWGFSVRCVRAD